MVDAMSSFRCYLRAAGIPDSVPIHVEENGWPTYGTRREDMQALVADRMIRAVDDFRGTYNVSDYRWFNLRDADTSDPSPGQHYGLLHDDYTEKPAFAVVASLFKSVAAKGGTLPARASQECLRHAGDATSTGIGLARIGDRKANVLRKLGAPASQSAASMRYCVEGGGELRLAFDTSGRLRFVASTSFSTRIRKIRTGSSLLRVKHVYPHAFWIGKRLLRAGHGSRVVFGSCSCGSVAFVGITNARSPAQIRFYAGRAGVPRAE